ncbi:hypothetical protein NPIL_564201 [Nephila pilipes]|uniref:Uncharacterized protein n=1 Tax=Nephila pilipes TaxID=299642 RepID=A0A8X6PSM3_NEPPI|nr:hypothetical protein NPIL_564201 [Nephila pilipes]
MIYSDRTNLATKLQNDILRGIKKKRGISLSEAIVSFLQRKVSLLNPRANLSMAPSNSRGKGKSPTLRWSTTKRDRTGSTSITPIHPIKVSTRQKSRGGKKSKHFKRKREQEGEEEYLQEKRGSQMEKKMQEHSARVPHLSSLNILFPFQSSACEKIQNMT